LQKEYEEMAIERKENDKEVEALRAEAEEIETKVSKSPIYLVLSASLMRSRWRII
jgi:hypothetical protein